MRSSVFVVDDDPSMRTAIMRLLKVHGFDCTLFESADALLDHGDLGRAFCVVMDIDLKGESGIGVCQRLVTRGIKLPVIFITGNDSETVRAAATAMGCLAYLTKPFPAPSLIESIEYARAAA